MERLTRFVLCRPYPRVFGYDKRAPLLRGARWRSKLGGDLLRRRRETPDLAGHSAYASTILRASDILVHLLRECVQRRCTGSATLHLRHVERGRDGCRSRRCEPAVPHQLIEVRPNDDERRWPRHLRLALRVVRIESHQL